jgi:hypothetical protein
MLIFAANVCAVHTAHAQWSGDSTANTPICTAADNQLYPAIVADGSGGFILAWGDARRNGAASYDIYAQRINAAGVAQWAADGVPICTTGSNQPHPKLIADGGGGAIIAWADARNGTSEYDIYAQRINVSGVAQWDTNGVPVCRASFNQLNPRLVSDGSGGAIITWDDARAFSNSDIYAQRIDASGITQWTADGVAISSASGDQSIPAMISDEHGGAIIAWIDGRVQFDADIYAQRINGSGVARWTADGVAVCTASELQYFPVLAVDGSGGAIITWEDRRNGNTNIDIYAQRVDSSGTALWTTDGVVICAAGDNQLGPQSVSDASGGAIITWWTDHASDDDVFAQRVNASGAVQWATDGVAVSAGTGDRNLPMITGDGSGGAIIAWNDGRFTTAVIFAQRFSASGVGQWRADDVGLAASGYSQLQGIVGYGDGGAVIAFMDTRSGAYEDIYVQQVDGDGRLGVTTGVQNPEGPMPDVFRLDQNYPNPFNPGTTIRYQLPARSRVTLRVFDLLGREIATLVDLLEEPGYKSVAFDGSGLTSGVYYLRLQADDHVGTRKLLLLR